MSSNVLVLGDFLRFKESLLTVWLGKGVNLFSNRHTVSALAICFFFFLSKRDFKITGGKMTTTMYNTIAKYIISCSKCTTTNYYVYTRTCCSFLVSLKTLVGQLKMTVDYKSVRVSATLRRKVVFAPEPDKTTIVDIKQV